LLKSNKLRNFTFYLVANEGIGDFIHSTTMVKSIRSHFPEAKCKAVIRKKWRTCLASWDMFDTVSDKVPKRLNNDILLIGRHCYSGKIKVNPLIWAVPNRDNNQKMPREPVYISNLKYMESRGFSVKNILPFWEVDKQLREKYVQEYRHVKRPIICIHNSKGEGFWHRRKWPIPAWKKLVSSVPATWIRVGSDDDWSHTEIPGAQMRSGLALEQVAAIISLCDAFIGTETGLTILAQAIGVPTILLSGPVDYLAVINATVIRSPKKECPWKPCYLYCGDVKDESVIKKCLGDPDKTPCMENITVDMVRNVLRGILA